MKTSLTPVAHQSIADGILKTQYERAQKMFQQGQKERDEFRERLTEAEAKKRKECEAMILQQLRTTYQNY